MRGKMLMAALALAGCGSAEEPVVVSQEAEEPAPERILYRDIEENDLFGASCAFAPLGGGSGAIAIAMQDAGFIKYDGAIVKLEPLAEEQELGPPEMKFAGEDYAFNLVLDPETEKAREGGGKEFTAELKVRSRDGTTIYDSDGLAQCAPAGQKS